jgi:hypothetical protein
LFAATLETALRVLDPVGLLAAHRMFRWSLAVRVPDPSGYRMRPGAYTVNGASITIDDDGLRTMPDRPGAHCTVGILGDSTAFGWGVGDTETVAYRLAHRFERVRWVNTARIEYNADNLRRVLDQHAVDGWLYIVNDNDVREATGVRTQWPAPPPALVSYGRFIWTVATTDGQPPPTWAAYDRFLSTLQQHTALAVGDAGSTTAQRAVATVGGTLHPWHAHRISAVDPHPTAEGHAYLADTIAPTVADWLPGVCDP